MYHVNPSAATPVFGPAAGPLSWTDLDLSAIIPASCVVRLILTSSNSEIAAFRPNGSTANYNSWNQNARGAAAGYIAYGGRYFEVWIPTVDGAVEWITNYAQTGTTIYVLGWFDATMYDPLMVGTPYGPVTPTDGSTLNISSVIGASTKLVMANLEYVSGDGNRVAFMPYGVAFASELISEYYNYSADYRCPQPNSGVFGVGQQSLVIAPTNNEGKFRVDVGIHAGNPTMNVRVLCTLDDYTEINTNEGSFATTGTWVDKDVSARLTAAGLTQHNGIGVFAAKGSVAAVAGTVEIAARPNSDTKSNNNGDLFAGGVSRAVSGYYADPV